MSAKVYLVTLNWNTTDYLEKLAESVRAKTTEPITWIIVDNGSDNTNMARLYFWADQFFNSQFIVIPTNYIPEVSDDIRAVIVRSEINLGCILAHNLAFDVAADLSRGQPYEIVMSNTDVEIHHTGWLRDVRAWADFRPEIGIVGLEHSRGEVCAAAIFLDASGNWYTQPHQTHDAVPVEGESVGLGLALIRWPVLEAGLRFDEGFKIYYKQDDDLCFSVRAGLGLEVWAYPIACVHWGRGALKANDYQAGGAAGQEDFERDIKRVNQAYFAKKWAWALRGRRGSLGQEADHLREMKAEMERRRS